MSWGRVCGLVYLPTPVPVAPGVLDAMPVPVSIFCSRRAADGLDCEVGICLIGKGKGRRGRGATTEIKVCRSRILLNIFFCGEGQ